MREIALITDRGVTLRDLERRLATEFGTYWVSPLRLGIEAGSRVGWLEEETPTADADAAPYSPEELASLGIKEPRIFLLTFEGRASTAEYFDFVRRSLLLLADDERIWVENGNQDLRFMRGREVAEQLRRNPTWDLDIEDRRP